MDSSGFKPVGVDIIVNGAAEATEKIIKINGVIVDLNKPFADLVNNAKLAKSSLDGMTGSTVQGTGAFESMNSAMGITEEQIRSFTTALDAQSAAQQLETKSEREKIPVAEEEANAIKKTNTSHVEMFTTLREGRLITGMMIADLALMNFAAGTTNVALQEMSKGIQVVIDSGMLALIATGDPVVAVLVAITAGLVTVAQASVQGSEGLQALEKELAPLAKKDDAIDALALLSKTTKEESEVAMQAAKDNKQFAAEMQNFVEQSKPAAPVLSDIGTFLKMDWDIIQKIGQGFGLDKIFGGIGSMGPSVSNAITGAEAFYAALVQGKSYSDAMTISLKAQEDELNRVANAQRNANVAITELAPAIEADKKALADVTKATEEWQKKQSSLWENSAKAVESANNTIIADQQRLNDTLDKDWRSLQDKLADIGYNRVLSEQKNAADIERINENLSQGIVDANQKMADSIAKAQQTLADRESDIATQLSTKQSESYRTYQKSIETTNNDIQKSAQELADKIVAINKKEVEDLANLDWTTGQKLNDAKTQNDKERILETHAHEAAAIRQSAEDARSSAQDTFEKAKQLSDQKKQIALEEYNYRTALNAREAAQQDADAKRRYAEEVAQAQKSNQEQIAQLQQRAAQERQIAAQRLADQETAFNHERDIARRSYEEQTNDARKSFEEQVKAAVNAANAKIAELNAEVLSAKAAAEAKVQYEQEAAYQIIRINQQLGLGTSGVMTGTYMPGMQGQTMPDPNSLDNAARGYANGGDFIANSPTLIQVGENYKPERVTITPMGANNSHNIGNVTVNITGNDPEQIWNTFQRKMQNEVWH